MASIVITATTPTKCGCCGTTGPCFPGNFLCRKRGGTASLVGNVEFTTPSLPPKKYLRLDVNGYWQTCNWTNPACNSVSGSSDRMNYLGSCVYNPISGLPTNTLNRTYGSSIVAPCTPSAQTAYDVMNCDRPYAPTSIGNGDYIYNGAVGQAIVTNPNATTRKWDYVGGVAAPCTLPPGGSRYRTWLGEVNWTLSDADTDSNAITRLLNSSTWSAYNDGANACLARWEQRNTGYDFAYQEAEWQILVTGLAPDTGFAVEVNYFRRVFGSGDFTLFQTETVYGYTDSGGLLLIEGNVPNEEGFETYAAQGPCA